MPLFFRDSTGSNALALPKAVLTQVLNILTLSSNASRKYLLSPQWARLPSHTKKMKDYITLYSYILWYSISCQTNVFFHFKTKSI